MTTLTPDWDTVTLSGTSLNVADSSFDDAIEVCASLAIEAATVGEARVATALHVGGLNSRQDLEFVTAMSSMDYVYADGAAVVTLAKLNGANSIERAATTDIGVPILERVAEKLNRTVRIALVGGPDGLAKRAAASLQNVPSINVVFQRHGYNSKDEWVHQLKGLRASQPDIVILGLGAPQEQKFCARHRQDFPPALVLTCGGWFGFLAGDEERAPTWMVSANLEWAYRMSRAPSRLGSRYVKGLATTARLAAAGLIGREGIFRRR